MKPEIPKKKRKAYSGFLGTQALRLSVDYDKYFHEGTDVANELEPYSSHNTLRLTVDEVVEKLKSIEYVQRELSPRTDFPKILPSW